MTCPKVFSRPRIKTFIMQRIISRFIYIFSVFAFLATASYAQVDTTMPQPETKSGSAAFLFAISGLAPFGLNAFPLRTFDSSGSSALGSGNSIVYAGGGKWYISDNFALRAL